MNEQPTACMDCTDRDSPDYQEQWEAVGCIRGIVYGYCTVDVCGGLCEDEGVCPCTCHDEGEVPA